MKPTSAKNHCILAIAPSTRGFGFAVTEASETLVDWGVKTVSRDKNAQSLEKIEEMITLYHPKIVVLENASAKGSRRSERIRTLIKQTIALATMCGVKVRVYSREQVMKAFLDDAKGTKHACAASLAGRFPEELGSRLPPKRRPWMSQDYRMSIFDAAALALMPLTKQR